MNVPNVGPMEFFVALVGIGVLVAAFVLLKKLLSKY